MTMQLTVLNYRPWTFGLLDFWTFRLPDFPTPDFPTSRLLTSGLFFTTFLYINLILYFRQHFDVRKQDLIFTNNEIF